MAKRKISNPLALAVLGCLYERPMHPYEMAMTLRHRAKQESIKLNYGSLYSVVDALERRGWIVSRETERDGRRPERTVYGLTKAGEVEFFDWLSELLGVPVKEYTQFEAGLSFMAALPPDAVVRLLRERGDLLANEISQMKEYGEMLPEDVLPRLFRIESEYWQMLREAELKWVRQLADDIENDQLSGIDKWREITEQLAQVERSE
ncbi:MAG TPA: PadR family transcriptional regulator [Nitrolancea sp.]|nr:PadR family transcriptional regulator [Nitrolancea sp.]